jgi:hypothetical protein
MENNTPFDFKIVVNNTRILHITSIKEGIISVNPR